MNPKMHRKRGRPSIIKTFDTETFIREIERHPALYDITCEEYGNREMKLNSWAEVGQTIYRDWFTTTEVNRERRVRDLIKKWKAIRDCFVRDHKQIVIGKATCNKKRRYMYYKELQFLLPHLKTNPNNSSNWLQINGGNEPDDSNGFEGNGPYSSEQIERGSPLEMYYNFNMNGSENFEEQSHLNAAAAGDIYLDPPDPDVYGHKSFLMSFVPILNSLPISDALQARLHISQIITTIHSQSLKSSSNGVNCTTSTGEDVKNELD